jgi:hypothetical protein
MPKLLAMGFKAQQRMIGTTAFGFGIIPPTGPLLFAVDSEYH